ncbi:hypothetical protein EAI_11581 [Harpegnathos saltator]|uniref:Uncharacterized protein n=1 Tax=Harpegnathos saltator TaxID=610380 RepID=E2BEZ7_HARSA|nr:hypothetical protein EAI_11581 [Harpegnathos saltator]
MSLAMIQRFALSCGKRAIDTNACRRIASSWHLTRRKPPPEHVRLLARHTYTIHTRLHHSTLSLYVNKLKQNADVDDIPTLQIKKRPPRKNKAVISDENTPKINTWDVKALATAEEYNLEALTNGLLSQQLYIPSKISTSNNCYLSVIVKTTGKANLSTCRRGSVVRNVTPYHNTLAALSCSQIFTHR